MIRLSRTITRRLVDQPAAYENGRMISAAITHEETTPYGLSDRGCGGTIQTHVSVEGPVDPEFTQEEATEVANALVTAYQLSRNDPARQRRIERTLLRMGLEIDDLVVLDD